MSNLIRVFVGSPDNVAYAREITRSTLEALNRELSLQDIHFNSWDFHDLPAGIGDPQLDKVDSVIKHSGLVILFFGSRLGKGTMHEFELGIKLHKQNKLLDLMLYFEAGSDDQSLNECKEAIKKQ